MFENVEKARQTRVDESPVGSSPNRASTRRINRVEAKIVAAVLALLFSAACFAGGAARPIDISECMIKNCMSRDVHVFSPEENFRVQAWFDITSLEDGRKTFFYPLFNVFNYTRAQARVVVGMQLLDRDEQVLLEVKGESLFEPTQQTEGSYETFVSINARPVTAEIVAQTKFLRVIFER